MSDKVTSLVLLASRSVCFSEVFVTSVGSQRHIARTPNQKMIKRKQTIPLSYLLVLLGEIAACRVRTVN